MHSAGERRENPRILTLLEGIVVVVAVAAAVVAVAAAVAVAVAVAAVVEVLVVAADVADDSPRRCGSGEDVPK